MAINFTEKQHWKARIEAKLNERIRQARAGNAELLKEFGVRARAEVQETFSLDEAFAEIQYLEKQIDALTERQENLIVALYVKITGDSEAEHEKWMLRRIEGEIADLERQKAEEMLLSHPAGREIAQLQQEKERLLDAIMLAANINQVITIWDQATTLAVGNSLPALQDDMFAGSDNEALADDEED